MSRPHPPDEQESLALMRIVFEDKELLTFQTDSQSAWCALAGLQLAWRHPGLSPVLKTLIEHLARQLQQAIIDRHPEAEPILEAGWNTDWDVP